VKVITPLLFVLLAVAPAIAQDQEDVDQALEERYGHLEKGKSGFRETWVNPNTDWTTFDKLYLWDAEFQFRDVGPARRMRSTMMNTRQREFGISEEDRLKFEETVSDIFVEEIQKARNFAIVDVVGPNTLIMRAAVLDIISKVPPESVGRVDVYLASVGEATLVLELIDVTDGEVAAIVAERRAFQSHGGNIDMAMRTTSASAWAEVRRWAHREAVTLRKELEKAIAGK
jgi:hypothetical protein